jgi:hypothetical protein
MEAAQRKDRGRGSRRNLPGLKLHSPSDEERPRVPPRWEINGFPAAIAIWTAEEWGRLRDRPADAREYPNGVRCALRME